MNFEQNFERMAQYLEARARARRQGRTDAGHAALLEEWLCRRLDNVVAQSEVDRFIRELPHGRR